MPPLAASPLEMALFGGQGTVDAHPEKDLLLESGDYLLQEDGVSTIVLEA